MGLQFEWDEEKEKRNRKKHDVKFEEAGTVFGDPLAAIFDVKHSENEQREIIVGHSTAGRLLLVCFNVREPFALSARVAPRDENERTMKKTQSADRPRDAPEEMSPEYRFDYSQARSNRFAQEYESGSRVVVLDPDVAEVFTTNESVNSVLRALLATMPKQGGD